MFLEGTQCADGYRSYYFGQLVLCVGDAPENQMILLHVCFIRRAGKLCCWPVFLQGASVGGV